MPSGESQPNSVAHAACPEREGCVRGEVLSSGFVLQPAKKKPALRRHGDTGGVAATGGIATGTTVTYVAQLGRAAASLAMADLVGSAGHSVARFAKIREALDARASEAAKKKAAASFKDGIDR